MYKCSLQCCLFASPKHKHSEDDSYDHPSSLKNRRNASLILTQTEFRTLKIGKASCEKRFFPWLYFFIYDGVIEVGGRLTENIDLVEYQHNQNVISKKSRLAKIILQAINLKKTHAPTITMLA